MNEKLPRFILDLLLKLTKPDLEFELLQLQIRYITDIEYEYTNYGVFINFTCDPYINKCKLEKENSFLNNVIIISEEVESDRIDAYLMLKNGIIDYLEIDSVSKGYPHHNLTNYTLEYEWNINTIYYIER